MRPLLVFLLGLLSYTIDRFDARNRLGATLNQVRVFIRTLLVVGLTRAYEVAR